MYAFIKASKVMGTIKTIIFKEVTIILSLYKTLVRPHVEYCASAWSPYYKKDKELFEKVQRRFTKMIVNMDGISYEDRLRSLKLWSLEERRNRQHLIEVFKMSKGMTRIRLKYFFMDQSAKPSASLREFPTGEATQGELQGESSIGFYPQLSTTLETAINARRQSSQFMSPTRGDCRTVS